jgi:hypothetical protein
LRFGLGRIRNREGAPVSSQHTFGIQEELAEGCA